MKILLYSLFPPDIGGTERVAELLADALHELGHEIRVATFCSKSKTPPIKPYDIFVNVRLLNFARHLAWCDVLLDSNAPFSKTCLNVFFRKPWFISQHLLSSRFIRMPGSKNQIRFFAWSLLRPLYKLLTVSRYMADQHDCDVTVVPNPYDERIFNDDSNTTDRRDICFVGRMQESKGTFLLYDAFRLLLDSGNFDMNLHFVGDGPAVDSLKKLVDSDRDANRIIFHGSLPPKKVAELLRTVLVVVVPSTTAESFGLVILEGFACGCRVVGTHAGGIPEALGDLGVSFTGTAKALAAAINQACTMAALHQPQNFQKDVAAHLKKYQRLNVAQAYVDLFQQRI